MTTLSDAHQRAAMDMPNPAKGYMDAAYGDYYHVQETINNFLWDVAELERQARIVLTSAEKLADVKAPRNTVLSQSGTSAFARALVRAAVSAAAKEQKKNTPQEPSEPEPSSFTLE